MTFRFLRPLGAVLILSALLPLSGCDESGLSTDTATAITDAVIARQNGDYATAIALLESAYDREPDNSAVRTELAATLLEQADLNLLDLDRISQFVVEGVGAQADTPSAKGAFSAGGETCRFATEPGATLFDPTAVEGFPAIEEDRETIRRAIALIEPVLPAVLRSFSPCTTIVDGQLVYGQAAAAAELRATSLTEAQISQLLATNALVRFLDAYLFVTTDVPQQTTWYRLANGSIGVCADDEDALVDQTEEAIETLGTALLSLDTRARSFGGATDIVELVTDAFGDISDGLGDYCASRT